MSTLEILRGARELLSDEARWAKQVPYQSNGRYCLIGACARAAGLHAAMIERGSVGDLLQRITGQAYPYRFNDDPATTHADVLAALDEAIRNEEAREQEFTASPEIVVPEITRALA